MKPNWQFPNARIVIFAKAPIAGYCKTRLQPDLSPMQSARLQEKFIYRTLETAAKANLAPIELWVSPDKNHPLFNKLEKNYSLKLYQQKGNDLGARMLHCLENQNDKATLLIGTDCPTLSELQLHDMLAAIHAEYDMAIAPALDGGYVAIATKTSQRLLFEHISWGTDKVFMETMTAAEALQFNTYTTSALKDIDNYQDYLEMCKKMPNLAV